MQSWRRRIRHAVAINTLGVEIDTSTSYVTTSETLQDGRWARGNIIIHKPTPITATHSPDIAVVVPVFMKGSWSAIPPTPPTISISAQPRLLSSTHSPMCLPRACCFCRHQSSTGRRGGVDFSSATTAARRGNWYCADRLRQARRQRVRELMDRYGWQMVLECHPDDGASKTRLRQHIAAISRRRISRKKGFLDNNSEPLTCGCP